jgi:hypothetical protein
MAEVTKQIQEVSNIPEWARPYATQLFGMTFGDPRTGGGGLLNEPYRTYEGQRVAGFNPLQEQAFGDIAAMGVSPQIGQATGLAGLAGLRAGEAGRYSPFAGGQYYQTPEMGRVDLDFERLSAPRETSYQMAGPERVAGPGLQQFQMGPAERVGAERVSAGDLRAAQTGFRPDLQAFQMGPAERVGAERFGLGAMQEYMSPYMQGVVEQQKRGAVQDYLRQMPGIGAASARAGARGGTREALLESEARRGLSERLGDIEATGLQQAYQQAASQFGADRAAQMQAALANQAAGLTTGGQNLQALLSTQQLGTQTGLQTALANLSAEQQARVQQQANQLQAQGMNQQTALQSALANQQAGLTTGQQNLAAQLGVQQLGAGQSLQAQLANQQAAQQAQAQNLQAQINQAQFGAQQAMQAGQLNQAAQLQQQAQALQQQQNLNQLAMQGAGLGAQYGLAGAQLGEQSRQFGAGLGLQGLQQQLAAAGQLGQLGQQQYQQQLGIGQAQLGAGAQIQGVEQQQLANMYQDFINRQQYPYKQLEFASGILRGFQPTGQTSTLYQPPGSTLAQSIGVAGGLGTLFGGLGSGVPTTGGSP